jgi:hypothetical protein
MSYSGIFEPIFLDTNLSKFNTIQIGLDLDPHT